MSSIKEQSLAGFQWNAIGTFSTYVVRFVLGIIIARLLLPEDYGVIGMLAIFMAIAQSFVDSGFRNALIRKIDLTETDCSTAFYFNIAVAILLYGFLFVAAPYIADFYNKPVLTEVVRVLSLTIVVNSMGIVPRALRSVVVDFKSQAFASIFAAVVSGLAGISLAYSGWGVWALVWQSVISCCMTVAVIWLFARWLPRLFYSWRSFKALFSYGSKLMLSGLLHTIYTHASSLLIGKFYTPAELGYYDRGNQLASLPSLNLSSIFYTVTFPILTKLQQDNNRLIHAYFQYLSKISLIVFFLMTLLAVVAKPLVLILLTEKWAGAVPFVQVFCVAYMFDSICKLNNNILCVKGWSGLFLRLEVIKKSVITPMFLLAIPFGPMAICFIAVLHTLVDIVCSTYYLRKWLGMELRRYAVIIKYLSISILACVPAFVICNLHISPWASLSLGTVTSIGMYGLLLHRDEHFVECVKILMDCLHKKRTA